MDRKSLLLFMAQFNSEILDVLLVVCCMNCIPFSHDYYSEPVVSYKPSMKRYFKYIYLHVLSVGG